MGTLRMAFHSLTAHKTRALLAMLGIFLGAFALTLILHIGKALTAQADESTQGLGPNLVQVSAGQLQFRREASAGVGVRTLSLADATALIQHIPEVASGAPYCSSSGVIRYGSLSSKTTLLASTPDFQQVRSWKTLYGRFLVPADMQRSAMVCVLGITVAKRLFTEPESALGKRVFFDKAILTVVGVLEEKGQDVAGTNLDDQVYVPLTSYMRRMANQDWISGVFLNLHTAGLEGRAVPAMETLLRERHKIALGRKDDFSVFSAKDAAQFRDDVLALMNTLGFLSASLSFAVGSLGILSIMVLMVRTRRLEIGIRRAVGASQHAIIIQFLVESGLMSGVGGCAGVLFACVLLVPVYTLGKYPFIFDIFLLAGTSVSSVLCGVLSGAYPAWQAAHVNVLDVLRNPE